MLEQKNKFCVGDTIEIMKPNGDNVLAVVKDMRDERNAHMDSCPHPGQMFEVLLSEVPDAMDLLRVAVENEH